MESLHWLCLEVGCLGTEENGFSHLFFYSVLGGLSIVKLNPFSFSFEMTLGFVLFPGAESLY